MRFFFLISLYATSLCGINHCVVWHPIMGADLATSGAFISSMTTDDSNYTAFSLPAGVGDNDSFSISNDHELFVGGTALSVGSYNLTIWVSDGGTGIYEHTQTVEIIAGASLPKVSSSYATTFALAQDGTLYSWGSGNSGQAGQGSFAHVYSPTAFASSTFGNEEIVDVVGLGWSAYVLTRPGNVYSFGWAGPGTLGLGDSGSVSTPTLITTTVAGKRIVRIGGNERVGALLEENGTVYVSGANNDNGLGLEYGTVDVPTLLPSTEPDSTSGALHGKLVVEFSRSRFSFFLLCADGSFYGFGRNEAGEMGLGDTTPRYTPTLIRSNVEKAFAGLSLTCYLLDNLDDLYISGSGAQGQRGTGGTTNTTSFVSLDIASKTTKFLNCGHHGVIAIMSDGTFYGFGTNSYTHVADSVDNPVLSPVQETRSFSGAIRQVALGQNTAHLLFSDGQLYSIGQNNAGQIGDGTSVNATTHGVILDLGDVVDLEYRTLPSQSLATEVLRATFAITWSSYAMEGVEAFL